MKSTKILILILTGMFTLTLFAICYQWYIIGFQDGVASVSETR